MCVSLPTTVRVCLRDKTSHTACGGGAQSTKGESTFGADLCEEYSVHTVRDEHGQTNLRVAFICCFGFGPKVARSIILLLCICCTMCCTSQCHRHRHFSLADLAARDQTI